MTERRIGDVTILDLSGNLTIDTGVQNLKDRVSSLVQQGRTHLIVNLADVAYVDSAGLGQLVASYTTVMRAAGALKLLHPNAKNQHLLMITRLRTVFEVFDSEAEAVASFAHARTGAASGAGKPG